MAGRLGLQADEQWSSGLEKVKQDLEHSLEDGQHEDQQQRRGLRHSFGLLCTRISEELMSDADKVVLPLLLGSEEEFETGKEGGSLSYREVVQELVAVVEDANVSESVLLDLLLTLRLAIYSSEPSAPGPLSPSELQLAFDRFARAQPVEKVHGAGHRTVEWIQNKFDELGCTAAAMRLTCHSNKKVQTEALRLLLALLQGPNAAVQKSALASLTSGRSATRCVGLGACHCPRGAQIALYLIRWCHFRAGFQADIWFGACSELLRAAIGKLHKAHKKSKENKVAKESGGGDAWQEGGSQSGLDAVTDDEDETLGRRGRVMMVLRLLELLCKKRVSLSRGETGSSIDGLPIQVCNSGGRSADRMLPSRMVCGSVWNGKM